MSSFPKCLLKELKQTKYKLDTGVKIIILRMKTYLNNVIYLFDYNYNLFAGSKEGRNER